jgi:hypothetical protein
MVPTMPVKRRRLAVSLRSKKTHKHPCIYPYGGIARNDGKVVVSLQKICMTLSNNND